MFFPAVKQPLSLHSTILQGIVAPKISDGTRPSDTSVEGLSRPRVRLPKVGDLVGDHYILVDVLGQGAFAKVYLAQRDDVPEHHVAIKIFARAMYEGRNVERELVMLATVGHPNVVQLKDHGMGDDYVWLTMPVYQGETLEERLKRGPLTMNEAYEIFVPVARGLEALHAGGLRHQDIKPDNIFLARFNGRVHPILLDLGVAAECDANFVAGTLLFASPEQIAFLSGEPGSAVLTEKMDTYGLGTTLLMSLVGRDAFPGGSVEEADEIKRAHTVRAEEPLSKDALPGLKGRARELFVAALKRWLALDPADRPTMSELSDELDVLREPEREEARAEERRRMRQKQSLQRVRAVALGLLLVAGGGAYYLYSKRETLALAGQLERAQREGAESFDKLDTCVASHTIEKSAASACRDARVKDQAEFHASLDSIKKAGSATVAERARQIENLQAIFAARLKTCEETGASAVKKGEEERGRIEAACRDEKAELNKAIEEQKKIVEARLKDVAVCDEARHALLAERDAWKACTAAAAAGDGSAAAPAAAGAAAVPVASAGAAAPSSAPLAQPSAAPPPAEGNAAAPPPPKEAPPSLPSPPPLPPPGPAAAQRVDPTSI
jgi:tRNA A-37 threonylcarbamoyl transferase component Bud32